MIGLELGVFMTGPRKTHDKIELRPDGWQRFESAVDAAVKSGPKHRVAKPSKRTPAKGRVRFGKPRKQP